MRSRKKGKNEEEVATKIQAASRGRNSRKSNMTPESDEEDPKKTSANGAAAVASTDEDVNV